MTKSDSKKLLVVSAEASGDLHAADVVKALKSQRPSLEVHALGGALLQGAGATLVAHIQELSVMGLSEVLRALPRILRVRKKLLEAIQKNRYDCALLVDGPDFNFRLFKALKKTGTPIVYYIPPKLWASRAGRIKKLRRYADAVCCIFPFEVEWYRKRGMEVTYVGHPVAEQTSSFATLEGRLPTTADSFTLALLPGSRRDEIKRLVPLLKNLVIRLKKKWPKINFVLPRASTVDRALLEELADVEVTIEEQGTLQTLQKANAAVVASGTATLETALMQVPQVVIYKVGWFTAVLFHLLVRLKFVSPVNIILQRMAVPELLQSGLTQNALFAKVEPLLGNTEERQAQVAACAEVKGLLLKEGAGRLVAETVEKRWR